MSADGKSTSDYVHDRLYARLFQPWTLPESEWPLCKEDWARVDAICDLPWQGRLLDFGSGDGTLAAMVCSRNPRVEFVACVEQDIDQRIVIQGRWTQNRWPMMGYLTTPKPEAQFDGALCCEVLEHLTPQDTYTVLCNIKRVLKPGAMLCVTVPTSHGSRAAYPGHVTMFSALGIADLVEMAGFTRKRCVRELPSLDNDVWYWVVAYA